MGPMSAAVVDVAGEPRVDPAVVSAASAALAGAADRLDAAGAGVQAVAGGFTGARVWSGDGRDAFLDAWARRRANLDQLAAVWREAAGVLRGLAFAFAAARAAWRTASARASAGGLVLGPGGVVIDPRTGLPAGLGRSGLDLGDCVAIEAAARAALDSAEAADREAAARLAALAGRVTIPVPADAPAATALLRSALHPAGAAEPGAAAGADPALAAAWWAALGPDRRRALVVTRPELVGGLDGLPARARDEANRRRLTAEIAATRDRLDTVDDVLQHDRVSGTQRDLLERERIRLRRHLHGLGRLRDSSGLLLLFDPAGDGRAAVAFGDPGDAPNIAVVVPGMNTTMDKFGATLTNAEVLAGTTERLVGAGNPQDRTAVVAWLGYDAPNPVQAADDRLAIGGAPSLRHFIDGLRVAAGDHRPHVSVVAHSYGSTLTGFAASDGGLAADDIAVVGSPGLGSGMTTIDELHLAPGTRLWAGRAPDDPIALTQELDPIARPVLEPLRRAGIAGYGDEPILRHGSDPSTAAFGARRFRTGVYADPDVDDPGDAHGHSAYFTASRSVRNLARIVSGEQAGIRVP
jgi:uncharacterized protein YukE